MTQLFKQKVLSSLFVGMVLMGGVLFLHPAKADAATYYFSPATGSYTIGSTVTASIVIDSKGQAINSGEATIAFPSDKLQFQSVSKTGSIFTLWTTEPTGAVSSVTLGGGLSNPGYTGSGGKVVTITWKALATGTATVSVTGGKILANDGAGTNVLTGSSAATYTIAKAGTTSTARSVSISSFTHKDAEWSSVKKAVLNWTASVDVTGYYIALDQTATTTPSGNLVTDTTITYENITDGIWYFHVKAASPTGIPVAHFALQIDTVAPDTFTVAVDNENKATNRTPKVTFDAKDATSGIDRYEAAVDGGAPFVLKSGDLLPRQHPGAHTIVVRAYDKAGNMREAQVTFTIEGIGAPFITKWTPHVNVMRPVRFEGRSDPSDTIVVYFAGKEVDRFVAKDRKSEDNGANITWTYNYTDHLFPGLYTFNFQRIDAAGVDSELTQDYLVKVHTGALILGSKAIAYAWIIVLLWIVIAVLTIWNIVLYGFRRKHRDDDAPRPTKQP